MNENLHRGFADAVASGGDEPVASNVKRRRASLMGAFAVFASTALASANGAASIRAGSRSSQDRARSQAPIEPLQAPPKPPQVALDACRGRAEGDECTVEFRGHKLSGNCRRAPGGGQDLACFPAGPPA